MSESMFHLPVSGAARFARCIAMTAATMYFLAVGSLKAAEVQVAADEHVFIAIPEDWTSVAVSNGSTTFPFATVRLSPTEPTRNAVVLISILAKDREQFRDASVLTTTLKGDSRPYVSSREELDRLEIKGLHIAAGLGFYANFTDPALAGKPVQQGKFKTATPVIIGLGARYLVKVTILCDDFASADYRQAIEIVTSIVVKP